MVHAYVPQLEVGQGHVRTLFAETAVISPIEIVHILPRSVQAMSSEHWQRLVPTCTMYSLILW